MFQPVQSGWEWWQWIVYVAVPAIAALVVFVSSWATIDQGHVGVVQRFGRYIGIARPGLNYLVPLIDQVSQVISLQQVAQQIEFQVITQDQAEVAFQITIIREPFSQDEEVIKLLAYKFVDHRMFDTALAGAVEASIRSMVADKKQAEILGLRSELVKAIKDDVDKQLESWGWHLRDTQINKISFGEEIMKSMSRVVAAKNILTAAEFEGQALLVQKTKEAEAHGKAIVISAQAEAEAEKQRGIGLAWFRDELAKGIVEAADMLASKHVGQEVMMFAMWTETLKAMVEEGKGNMFFFDGSPESLQRTLRQLQGMGVKKDGAV